MTPKCPTRGSCASVPADAPAAAGTPRRPRRCCRTGGDGRAGPARAARAPQCCAQPSVASSPAISRPRRTRLSSMMYSPSVWKPPPSTPSPSSVGNAHRAGEVAVRAAARALVRQLEAEIARDARARAHRAPSPAASGSHTGRVTPRRTANGDIRPVAVRQRQHRRDAAIEIRLPLGHAERLGGAGGGDAVHPLPAVDHADAERAVLGRHRLDRQHLPRHLARSPSAPRRGARRHGSAGRSPPDRSARSHSGRSTTPPSLRAGSGTSTKRCRAASASIRSRVLGLPTSSSQVNSTVTGSLVATPARASWRSASSAR